MHFRPTIQLPASDQTEWQTPPEAGAFRRLVCKGPVGFALIIAFCAAGGRALPRGEGTALVAAPVGAERPIGPGAGQEDATSRPSSVGDLMVSPTRVVLEGRKRNAELTLINTGSQRATYRISFIQMRMTDTGEM